MSPAERQLQPLLEKDYREDVKAYMYEMQVSVDSRDWSPLRARARFDASRTRR